MVRIRSAFALALAVSLSLSLAGSTSASAASGSKRCRPAGSTTLAESTYARVYRQRFRGDRSDVAYACVLRTGRRFQLDDPDRRDTEVAARDNEGRLASALQPRLARLRLAYILDAAIGADSKFETLYLLDLGTGKRTAWARSTRTRATSPLSS